jgi:hypothetical protein
VAGLLGVTAPSLESMFVVGVIFGESLKRVIVSILVTQPLESIVLVNPEMLNWTERANEYGSNWVVTSNKLNILRKKIRSYIKIVREKAK